MTSEVTVEGETDGGACVGVFGDFCAVSDLHYVLVMRFLVPRIWRKWHSLALHPSLTPLNLKRKILAFPKTWQAVKVVRSYDLRFHGDDNRSS